MTRVKTADAFTLLYSSAGNVYMAAFGTLHNNFGFDVSHGSGRGGGDSLGQYSNITIYTTLVSWVMSFSSALASFLEFFCMVKVDKNVIPIRCKEPITITFF